MSDQNSANTRELNIPYIDEPESNSQVNNLGFLFVKINFDSLSGQCEKPGGYLTKDRQHTSSSYSTALKLTAANIYTLPTT